MKIREFFLNEETYGLSILDNIKEFKKDDVYVIFSNTESPKTTKLVDEYELNGIVAYPIKWVFNTLKRGEMLNIRAWTIKKNIIIAKPSRGQILNINELNKSKELYNSLFLKLKKFYFKEDLISSKDVSKAWYSLEKELDVLEIKENFKKLIKVMNFINLENKENLNRQFKYLGYSAVLSPVGFTSLMTNNPEIIFLNSKNVKIIKTLENK